LLNDTGLKAGTYTAGSKVGVTLDAANAIAANQGLTANALQINGVNVGAANGSGTASVQAQNVADAINLISDKSGVKAYITGATLSLYSVNGSPIIMQVVTATQAAAQVTAATGLSTAQFGSNADTTNSLSSVAALADDAVRINGVNIGAIGAAGTAAERGSQMSAAINAKSSQTGVTATFSSTSGAVSLTAVDGRNIITSVNGQAARLTSAMTGLSHSEGSGTVGTRVETVLRSTVSLTSNSPSGITIGAVTSNATSATGLTAGNKAAVSSPGSNTVDISTATGAQSALTVLDKAINTVTDSRASMGAYQNRLTAAIANLETTSMNLQASRSRILDTDYAKETTNLAKTQIITQAATAMLAQANQSAQSVLALLK
jgi:flagellin